MQRSSVRAFNTATASDNKIHDDAVASTLGFSGGLVPGVDVLAYLARLPMQAWGEDWLAGGRLQARFHRPVYDGEEVALTAEPVGDGGLRLAATAGGDMRAEGMAALASPSLPRSIARAAPPFFEWRPAASPAALAASRTLGSIAGVYDRASGLSHLADVREDPDLFDGGRLAHPGWLARRANDILMANVRMGPWIHVESDFALHSALADGEPFEARAEVAAATEPRGHRMVELDVLILSGERPVVSGRHLAIYEPRQLRAG